MEIYSLKLHAIIAFVIFIVSSLNVIAEDKSKLPIGFNYLQTTLLVWVTWMSIIELIIWGFYIILNYL